MDLDGFYVKIWKNPDNLEKSGKLSGKIWKNLAGGAGLGWAWEAGLGFKPCPGWAGLGLRFSRRIQARAWQGLKPSPE